MTKIELLAGDRLPPVHHANGRLFDNARGGPYKYGFPLILNAEAIKRLSAFEI